MNAERIDIQNEWGLIIGEMIDDSPSMGRRYAKTVTSEIPSVRTNQEVNFEIFEIQRNLLRIERRQAVIYRIGLELLDLKEYLILLFWIVAFWFPVGCFVWTFILPVVSSFTSNWFLHLQLVKDIARNLGL